MKVVCKYYNRDCLKTWIARNCPHRPLAENSSSDQEYKLEPHSLCSFVSGMLFGASEEKCQTRETERDEGGSNGR